jgi:hypothetical protein
MPISDYTPQISDVGALIRSRTRNDQGAEIGTFDATTRPTNTEASSLIQDAINEAYPVFGEDIPDAPGSDPDALRKAAARIVALRAAALVEQSYFPEQISLGRSAYPQLQQSFNDGLKRLGTAISEVGAGDAPGTGDDYTSPIFDYGSNDGMIGFRTRW